MDYKSLIAEHDHIDALCAGMTALADPALPRPADAMALLRELALAVDEHLAAEDRLIYDRMWPSDDAAAAQSARRFVEDFAVLVADWTIYLTEWTEECVAIDWPLFCEQTHAIMARVRDRVAQENALLYPSAFRAGLLTLKPAASRVAA